MLASLALSISMTSCKSEPKAAVTPEASAKDNTKEEILSTGKIQYTLTPDGRNWKVVTDDAQDQIKIKQYILENEQPENVTELFTITEMTDVNITPSEYFSQFVTELQKRYSDYKVESKIINQQTNSLFGEWWIDGQSPDKNQHEWIRIMKKGNDIAVLRYSTMHTDEIDSTRKTWESILSNAKF